jgi:methanethiol S-methyltransferase
MSSPLILLAILWASWCLLHSLLISPAFTAVVSKCWGRRFVYYRLFYNIFSLLTLLPLWLYTRSLSARGMRLWEWPYTLLQGGLSLVGLVLFWAGARRYDLAFFAGLRQITDAGKPGPKMTGSGLQRDGVLGFIRHPWYSGALCLLWSQKMDGPTGVMTVVLSVYLVVGAFLEERKLVQGFGEEYRRYQREVSMFFPFQWLVRRLIRK